MPPPTAARGAPAPCRRGPARPALLPGPATRVAPPGRAVIGGRWPPGPCRVDRAGLASPGTPPPGPGGPGGGATGGSRGSGPSSGRAIRPLGTGGPRGGPTSCPPGSRVRAHCSSAGVPGDSPHRSASGGPGGSGRPHPSPGGGPREAPRTGPRSSSRLIHQARTWSPAGPRRPHGTGARHARPAYSASGRAPLSRRRFLAAAPGRACPRWWAAARGAPVSRAAAWRCTGRGPAPVRRRGRAFPPAPRERAP